MRAETGLILIGVLTLIKEIWIAYINNKVSKKRKIIPSKIKRDIKIGDLVATKLLNEQYIVLAFMHKTDITDPTPVICRSMDNTSITIPLEALILVNTQDTEL